MKNGFHVKDLFNCISVSLGQWMNVEQLLYDEHVIKFLIDNPISIVKVPLKSAIMGRAPRENCFITICDAAMHG